MRIERLGQHRDRMGRCFGSWRASSWGRAHGIDKAEMTFARELDSCCRLYLSRQARYNEDLYPSGLEGATASRNTPLWRK